MTYMAYLLDLAVILFFVLSIVIGCKRGVVKALSRLAGIVAAVVLAFLFCGPLASLAFDRWVGPSLQTTVAEKIEDSRETGENAIRTGVESALEALPAPVLNLMKNNGIGTVDEIIDRVDLSGADQLAQNADGIAEQLTAQVARPVIVTVLRVPAFLLILLLGIIAALLLSGLLDALVSRIPFVKGVNRSLGAVFGALEGVLLVLVFVGVVQIVAELGADTSPLNQTVLDKTLLTGPIAQINPIGSYFRSVLSVLTGD